MSNAPPPTVGAIDAFVSYSRRDRDAVLPVVACAERAGRTFWVDTSDIPAGSEWRTELTRAIERAHTVVCFLTPAWLASAECRRELEYAVELGKKIVPVQLTAVSPAVTPVALQSVQWVDARSSDAPATAARITAAIDSDPEAIRAHTQWLTRAIRWEEGARHRSLLPRGRELRAAEAWLQRSGTEPRPTALQRQFVAAARRSERHRMRLLLSAAAVAVVVSVTAAVIAVVQRGVAVTQRTMADSRALAASAAAQLTVDPELSVMLAQQAWRTAPTSQALTALRTSLEASRIRRTITTGSTGFSDVLLTPDQSLILALGSTGLLEARDASTGALRSSVEVSPGHSFPYLFTDRSRTTGLTLDQDGVAVRWSLDPPSGRLTALRAISDVAEAAVSPDGHRVVVATRDGTVHQSVDAAEFTTLTRVADDETVAALSLSADGTVLGIGTRLRSYVDLTLPAPGVVAGRLYLHRPDGATTLMHEALSPISDVQLALDGSVIMVHPDAQPVLLLSTVDGAEQLAAGDVSFLAAMDPDGGRLATSDIHGQVSMLDRTGTRTELARATGAAANRVVFSADGALVAVVGYDGVARVWATGDGSPVVELPRGSGSVLTVDFSADGDRLVTGHDDGAVRVWELSPPPLALPAGFPTDDPGLVTVSDIAFDTVDSTVFTVAGPLIQPWNVSDGQPGCTDLTPGTGFCPLSTQLALAAPEIPFRERIALSPDGQVIAVLTPTGSVLAYATAAPFALRWQTPADGEQATFGHLEFAGDGSVLLAQRGDRPPRLIDTTSGAVRATVQVEGPAAASAVLLDGDGVLTATVDGAIDVYGPDGRHLRAVTTVPGPVFAVAAAPGGASVAVGSGKQVLVVEFDTGRVTATMSGHAGPVQSLAWTPDGAFVISGGLDPTVRVWDPATQQQILTRTLPRGTAQTVVAGRDGHTFAVAGDERAAYLFDCEVCLPASALDALATSRITRTFTTLERTRFEVPN